MATTKDITMKQFNGTDYDTLYPKTDVKQVENLTPSSIGAVAKTGDTMTGNLSIQRDYPQITMTSPLAVRDSYLTLVGSEKNLYLMNRLDVNNRQGIYITPETSPLSKALRLIRVVDGTANYYSVLHEGNLSDLGVARIATGSYVGTGNCGSDYPMLINVGFTPKFFWIGLIDIEAGSSTNAAIMLGTGYDARNGLFIYPGTKFISSPGSTNRYYVTVTWGSTMKWYGQLNSATDYGKYQFNESGVTYYWVAIG